MEWVLEHLQFVIALILVGGWVLNNFRKHAAGRQDAGREAGGATPPAIDVEEQEHTRRIQEEIRRRILARQRGEAVASQPPPLRAAEEREVEEPEWLEEGPRPQVHKPPPMPTLFPQAPDSAAEARARTMDVATDGILEQQRLLAQQLEALRVTRALGTSAIPPIPALEYGATEPSASAAAGAAVRRLVRADLAARGGLRRAIILREILGEAPGLKRGMPQLPRR